MQYTFIVFLLLIIALCSMAHVNDAFSENDKCATDGECQIHNNTDYYGYTFSAQKAQNYQECCNQCLLHPTKCKSWSFDEHQKICNLKYGVPEAEECANVTSGYPKPLGQEQEVQEAQKAQEKQVTHPVPKRLGCFKDDQTRFLKGLPAPHHINMPDLTHEKCFNHCRTNKFRYAGLQDAQNCFCDNFPIRGFGEKRPDSECNLPCKGESSKMCGAPWHQDIYDLTPNEPEPKEIKIGCYKDDGTRFLQGLPAPHYIQTNDMTPEKCFAHCRERNFRYAGLQDGHACSCDNQPVRGFGEKRPENECSKPCVGDNTKTCGNPWLQEIYDLQPGKPLPPPPTPPKPPVFPPDSTQTNFVTNFDCSTSKFMPNALLKINAFTLFLQINVQKSLRGWQHILHGGDASSSRRTPGIWTFDGMLHVRASSKGEWNDGQNCYTLKPQLQINQPYELVTVYNVNEIVVYLNKQHIATCPTKGEIIPETDLYIGKSPPYEGLPAIISVAYFNKALNPEQLRYMGKLI